MRLGLREKVYILLLTALPVAAWWFVLRENSARNAEMMAAIVSQQEKIRALPGVNRAIDRLEQDTDRLAKSNESFHSRLPTENDVDKVLQETWQLAESNQLTTKSIRTVENRSDASAMAIPYGEQPIAMQIEGDFLGFYKFLLAIENQPRVMRIQRMDLKYVGPGKNAQGSVQADIQVSVFYEDRKAPAGNSRS